MKRFARLSAVASVVLAGFMLVGCQSTTPAATASSKSVIAGGTTFVQVPTGEGQTQIVAYTEVGKTPCPECQAVATKYFETGVLDESVCKTCGSHLYTGQGELIQPKSN